TDRIDLPTRSPRHRRLPHGDRRHVRADQPRGRSHLHGARSARAARRAERGMTVSFESVPTPAPAPGPGLVRLWREFAESPVALAALACVAALFALALAAPWIAPQNPYDLAQLSILDNKLPPGAQSMDGLTYWLGTDDQGRDLVSAILYGLRLSLFVAATATALALAIGAAAGTIAAYFGGIVDAAIMRVVDIQLSFPAILIALTLLAILGKGVDKVVIALVLVQWAYYARTIRGSALVERRREYIEAPRLLALSPSRIMFRHLLPNAFPPPIVVTTLQL